jgi:hypothetical protein
LLVARGSDELTEETPSAAAPTLDPDEAVGGDPASSAGEAVPVRVALVSAEA